MDESALQYQLPKDRRRIFEDQGFLVLEDVLDPQHVSDLTEAVDRLWNHLVEEGHDPSKNLLHHDYLWRDPIFVELIDHPATLPLVWSILGWNIYLYHHHLGITPQEGVEGSCFSEPLAFHQDSGRVNDEIESRPRPRLSMKVVLWLSDVGEPGRGNFWVVPGSHLRDSLEIPSDRNPDGAIPVCARPGDVTLFDRRLWHARSPNHSSVVRKVLFYGYAYRWMRPQFEPRLPDDLLKSSDPIRRQLLGQKVNETGFYNVKDEDAPLKTAISGSLNEMKWVKVPWFLAWGRG